jgi:hypothetical protein
VKSEATNPFWAKAHLDQFVFVTVNPHPPIEEVSVKLFEIGYDIRVRLADWEDWLDRPVARDCSYHLVIEAIEKSLPGLRQALPTALAVLESVDVRAKKALFDQQRQDRERRQEAQRKARQIHNRACLELANVIERDGVKCPHCGKHTKNVRFLDIAHKDKKSYFICRECAHSFEPADVPGFLAN